MKLPPGQSPQGDVDPLSGIAHIREHGYTFDWYSGICDHVVTTDSIGWIEFHIIPIQPMKLTINAQVYDTQKATPVAKFDNGGASKLHSVVETLYRSLNGNWFLHGRGGALTEYAQYGAETITSGERITPMTEAEALDWCEIHLAQDAIEHYFGHLIKGA